MPVGLAGPNKVNKSTIPSLLQYVAVVELPALGAVFRFTRIVEKLDGHGAFVIEYV